MIELKEENINATLYFILDYNEADFTGELIFYDDHAGVKVIPFPPFRLAQPADQQLHLGWNFKHEILIELKQTPYITLTVYPLKNTAFSLWFLSNKCILKLEIFPELKDRKVANSFFVAIKLVNEF